MMAERPAPSQQTSERPPLRKRMVLPLELTRAKGILVATSIKLSIARELITSTAIKMTWG